MVRKEHPLLDRRLDEVGWALFLIIVGCVWLLPAGTVPDTAWLIAAGAILLGINLVRHLTGLRASGIGIVLGLLSLAAGLRPVFHYGIEFFPLILVFVGSLLLLRPLFTTHRA